MDKEKEPSCFPFINVQQSIVSIRQQQIIVDADVAHLYGVETKRINEAVRNNPDKFPSDYMFVLTKEEVDILRSKNSSTNLSLKSRTLPKAFTEKGLYMLATILKSKHATTVTFAIIESFAKVRELKRELLSFHQETDKSKQGEKMNRLERFCRILSCPILKLLKLNPRWKSISLLGKLSIP